MMKKNILFVSFTVLITIILNCIAVCAESNANYVDCTFTIIGGSDTEMSLTLEINGKEYSEKLPIHNGDVTKSVHFATESYEIGTEMKLTLNGGVYAIKYYNDVYTEGQSIVMSTYSYNGQNYTSFDMDCIIDSSGIGNNKIATGIGSSSKPIYLHKDYSRFNTTCSAYIDGDVWMVPIIEVAKELNMNVNYDAEYNSVPISFGGRQLIYNLNNVYTSVNGEGVNISKEPTFVGSTIMAPLDILAETFNIPLEVQDEGDHYNINMSCPAITNIEVNAITSRTDYLVWVSKHEFKVRVYLGKQYDWKLINEFPCSIGAPGTPTITGQYEYIERVPYWNYGSYYCGPIMRFHNGYALHSTLQYWNGGAYDGRLGLQISHGCVRMDPPDIQWLIDYVSLYSRIYLTE